MGACRTRRPFVWQDEMAEVKNLFRRVDRVRRSAFTGFSLWKDEPTAETLSKNRLLRRRSQYALDLTHLNYGESPYESFNHIHNIRGMCARIQRQSHFVERKKKGYDVDLQPALLRRPVTSYSWLSKELGSEKSSLRSCARPGSAPSSEGIPLHYTPSKPTMLFDATHRCPRTASGYCRRPSTKPSGRNAPPLKVTKNDWNEVTSSGSGLSSPVHSVGSSERTISVVPNSSTSFRLSADSSPANHNEIGRKDLRPPYPETIETTSNVETASALLSSEFETDQSGFASSRPPSVGYGEKPPSRMMSKRPPSAGISKSSPVEDKGSDLASVPHKDAWSPRGESTGREILSTPREEVVSAFTPSLAYRRSVDGFSLGRPPSRSGDQRSRFIPSSTTPKGRSGLFVDPPDGASGLWALKQEYQRPTSAGTMTPDREPGAAARHEIDTVRPATSPSRRRTDLVLQDLPVQERVSRFGCRSPSANIIARKNEHLELNDFQRASDQVLQQVALSDYNMNNKNYFPARTDTYSEPQSSPHLNQSDVSFYESQKSFEQTSDLEPLSSDATAVSGSESHVMIKHSTDPYTDFKNSMLRMIHEENLYNKPKELEELFQYYMDLNPAVHHDVLRTVVIDIRREIVAGNGRG